jgi:predicted DNA-binding transcriptional regulator AlpA
MSTNNTDNLTIIRKKQLAAQLGVSPVTLWRMRNELPPQVQISRGVRGWRERDIAGWLAKRSVR